MDIEKNNGAQLEGMMMEIAGLILQDTNGEIEYLRKTTTNQPDGGIDGEFRIRNGNFRHYWEKL